MGALFVGLFIVGLLLFVLQRRNVNETKTLMMKIDHDVGVVTNQIFSHLVDYHKCVETFDGTAGSLSPTNIVSEVDVTPSAVTPVTRDFDLNSKKYGNSGITISSYALTPAPVPPDPERPFPELSITYHNPNKNARSTYYSKMFIYIDWDGTPFTPSATIKKCQAITTTNQIWTAGSGGSLFYIGDSTLTGTAGVYWESPPQFASVPPLLPGAFDPLSFVVSGDVLVSRADMGVGPGTSGRVTAVGYQYESDSRQKKNIETIADPIDLALKLKGRRFKWKFDSKADYGFVAQEMNEVLPELVKEGPAETLSVDYAKVTSVLVEAVKEQQKQLDSIKESLESF